jgi:hypothetical protein
MALEDIWNVERGERTEIPFARSFIEAIGCLIESQSRNESFERNAVPLFDLVYEGIETGIDELRGVVQALGHAVEGMEGLLGDYASTFAEACGFVDEALARGREWLGEHRDVIEAVARVVVVVAFCVEAPPAGIAFVTHDPAVVLGPMRVIGEAIRDA